LNAVSKFAGVLAVAFVAACGGGQESKNPPERKLTSEEQKAVAAVVASAERDQALYSKGLAAPARTESARAQDAHRKPQDLLNLLRVQPGMAIADSSGSDSYMSDILAGLEPSGVKVMRVGTDASGLAALQPGSVDAVLSRLPRDGCR
jgi:predicted methyltransferase